MMLLFLIAGAQSVIWWDHRSSSSCGGSCCHEQTADGETRSEWYVFWVMPFMWGNAEEKTTLGKWVFVWMDQATVWERRAARHWGKWWREWTKQTCWDPSGSLSCCKHLRGFAIQGLHLETVDISPVMMKGTPRTRRGTERTRRKCVKATTRTKQTVGMDMTTSLWGEMDKSEKRTVPKDCRVQYVNSTLWF